MKCGRILPRPPLGGDDEFVVKVAWEGLEEAESTWEPAQGDAAEDESEAELEQRYGLRLEFIVAWRGIPDYELLIF